jgi:hypothetical protein
MTRTNGVKGAGFLMLLVALLLAATWLFFKAFIVASAVTGALAAVLIRRWHTRHPSVLPYSPGHARGRRSTCRAFRSTATQRG